LGNGYARSEWDAEPLTEKEGRLLVSCPRRNDDQYYDDENTGEPGKTKRKRKRKRMKVTQKGLVVRCRES